MSERARSTGGETPREEARADAPAGSQKATRERTRSIRDRFLKSKLNVAALVLVAGFALVAVFADFIAADLPIVLHLDGKTWILPNLSSPASRTPELRRLDPEGLWEAMGPDDWAIFTPVGRGPTDVDLLARLKGPSAEHWLGTDALGRDVLARIVHGTRISLSVGVVAVGLYVLIGVLLGALAGFYGGWIDQLVSRLIEVKMVFPTFFLILTIMGIVERPSIWHVMLVIGLTGWPGVARLIRGEILRVRELDYVAAIRALGGSDGRILLRHVIPNAMGPVLVAATFGLAGAILTESSLSFLGFGTPPPTASWGELLTQAYEHAITSGAWWLTVFPGLAIFLTVTAYNLVGEGLRDAMDPRLRS
ncbi:ABC transporter permease [Vulgatibacter incomptus]|uniref:Dipeptide transport system permease protein DppC n=1 Tax=Vulgatibacter incomptus TaxID=1391653 RepID=A0A0K1PC08_9BACT|nr:ABC transporter permease [Vulgatibacter incomptus]AKU91060.1 Dipeptide transport system permease protein DppC [Vulgatibacter incomptus]